MNGLIAKINHLYNLNLTSSEKVTKGFLSENHILLGNGSKYFLKRYRFDNEDRIREIHSVKKYFADGGIPVILPIPHKDGGTSFSFENAYFALFPFVGDKQLERGDLDDEAIKSLGETLGKIHLLGRVAKLPIQEKFKAWGKEKTLEKIDAISVEIKKKSDLNDFDKLALESVETKKKHVLSNKITYEDLGLPSDHLIHGDYLDHNVFFGVDNHASFVFDFEKTDYSPRMYELYRSLMYSFLSGTVTDTNIQRAKLYLNSYLNIYPTSLDELSRGLELFCLKSIHGVWVESEHYLKDNSRVDEFLSSDFQRIKYLTFNLEQFKDQLLS